MRYLIDSDVIIDYLHNQEFAVRFFDSVKGELYVSIISWAEIMYSFKKSTSRDKHVYFLNFLKERQISVLPINEKVADSYLDIKIELEKRKIPLADFDLLIAGTATSNDLTLVTRNIKHFSRIADLKLKSIL